MTRLLDVLDLLTVQHAEIDELIARLRRHRGDPAIALAQLSDVVAAHFTAEETVFYPAIYAETGRRARAVDDHLAIKRALVDMLDMAIADEQFYARLAAFETLFARHAPDEEERGLFATVRAELAPCRRAALGDEVLAVYDRAIDRGPRGQLIAEVAEVAEVGRCKAKASQAGFAVALAATAPGSTAVARRRRR